MKKIIILILILIALFIVWKKEPWVKTFQSQQACEDSTQKNCTLSRCDLVTNFYFLQCPHGGKYWTPVNN